MDMLVAEFVGTALLIFLGNGVVANVLLTDSKGQNGGWIVITFGWGLAVAMSVYAVGRISGAHINPAVTVGLASINAFPWSMVPGYVIAQVLGAMTGSTLVAAHYSAHWGKTDNPDLILACHSTSPAVRRMGPAFISEVMGTAVLVFMVLALGKVALGAETDQQAWATAVGTWFGPFLVGMLVLSIGLSLGGPTGYAINPARDLGPRIMHSLLPLPGKRDSDWSYAWVPVVAPVLGGVLGAQLFSFLKF